MLASEFIKMYQGDPSTATRWLEENKDNINDLASTFTLDQLMELAGEFAKKNPVKLNSLRYYVASSVDKQDMENIEKALLLPITTLISSAPIHFAALINSPEDLESLYLLSAVIAEQLILLAPSRFSLLFQELDHFLVLNTKLATCLSKVIPTKIAGLFKHFDQFSEMPEAIQSVLTQFASATIAPLFQNAHHFNLMNESVARNLIANAPLQIAMLFKTVDEFLTMQASKSYQRSLQLALIEGASEQIAALFVSTEQVLRGVLSPQSDLIASLVKKQHKQIAPLYTRAEQVGALINTDPHLAIALFSLETDVFIQICRTPDALIHFAQNSFRDLIVLFDAAIQNAHQDLLPSFIESWCQFPVEAQINCLLISLSVLQKLKLDAKNNLKVDAAYHDALNRLRALEPSYNEVSTLSFHGQYLTDVTWNIISAILDKAQPKEIQFLGLFTCFDSSNCLAYNTNMNLSPDCTVPFVVQIMSNTQLVSCNFATFYGNRILSDILQLVLERNGHLNKASSPDEKESFLEKYSPLINAKVREFKTDRLLAHRVLTELPESKQHSQHDPAFFTKKQKEQQAAGTSALVCQ